VHTDRQYLVLFRDPREALISWFRLKARKGEVEYTRAAWEMFSEGAWPYFGGFFNKWIVQPIPRRLVVDYADLLASPELMLAQMVELLSHRPACADNCRDIVATERIQPKSRLPLFAFGESAGLEHPSLR
jgi:hypothetical protein